MNISWVPPLTTVMTFNPLLKRMGISIVRCLRGESPDSWNICASTYFVQNPSWNGWRTFQEPHVARRCHAPEKHLVVRFRCIIGELRKSRDWTIRSSGLLLKVSHVISFVVSVLTYHASPWLISGFSFDTYAFLLEFSSYWFQLLTNMLRKTSAHFGQNDCWNPERRLLALRRH